MNTIMTQQSRFTKEDRVRARTKPELNQKIDSDLERRLKFYAAQDKETISERIEELGREWDIERIVQVNAASLGLAGVVFGIALSRKWLLLPLVVSGFLLQHAMQGWCPPVPWLRRNGVRTRMEIEQERYALKILRGDFDNIERKTGEPVPNVTQVVQGVLS